MSTGLARRASAGFLWNQFNQIVLFGLTFLLSIALTRGLGRIEYGVYASAVTLYSTLLYFCALGLEDAVTVYLPQLLVQGKRAEGASLLRRVFGLRVAILAVIGIVLVFSGPLLRLIFRTTDVAAHTVPLAAYLFASGLGALAISGLAALLRTRTTFIVNSICQAAMLAGVVVVLRAGYGLDGALWMLAAGNFAVALALLAVLSPYMRPLGARFDLRTIRQFAGPVWLTNLTNYALGKEMDILLLGIFAVAAIQIGYYNLAYQLTSAISLILIAGLAGVGQATMSEAVASGDNGRLALIWGVMIKTQVLLAIPLLVFCIAEAPAILARFYGGAYLGAVVLLQVYAGFNIAGRAIGGGVNLTGLYVLRRQKLAMRIRWGGLALNFAGDCLLIPHFGALGAFIATGSTQVLVLSTEMAFLRRSAPIRYPMGFTVRVLIASALAALPWVFFRPTGWVGLIGAGLGYSIVLIIALLITRPFDGQDRQLLAQVSPRLLPAVRFFMRPGSGSGLVTTETS